VWEGIATFNDGNGWSEWWDLYLKENSGSVTGTLVSVFVRNHRPAVVSQSVVGEIGGQEIHFSGQSYSYLSLWKGEKPICSIDNVTGKIVDDGAKIQAVSHEAGTQSSGTVTFRLAKTENDPRIDVSGVWIGEATYEFGTEGLVLCLEQTGNALNGTLYIAYSKGGVNTVVCQRGEGTIENLGITIKGSSYSLIQKGDVTNWLLDDIIGEVTESGGIIQGVKVDEQQHRGKVVLRLGRTLPGNRS